MYVNNDVCHSGLVELGRIKSTQYWPSLGKSQIYDDNEVSLLDELEDLSTSITFRKFKIENIRLFVDDVEVDDVLTSSLDHRSGL